MPSTSKAQHNFMAAIANSPSFAKKAGVPMSVGKDFTAADKALKLSTSARNRADLQTVNNPKTTQGRNELFKKGGDTMATKIDPRMMAIMAANARGGARPPMGGMGARPPMAPPGGMAPPGMKRGGMANFEKSGKDVEVAGKGKEGSKKEEAFDRKQMVGMSHGGMHKMPDGKMMKNSAMKKGGMTKMASGGFVRAADGIAQQGKTKAKQIKMKSGGMAC